MTLRSVSALNRASTCIVGDSNTGGIKSGLDPRKSFGKEQFIPAIIGKNVSNLHRRIFALSVRFGGLGIVNSAKIMKKKTLRRWIKLRPRAE